MPSYGKKSVCWEKGSNSGDREQGSGDAAFLDVCESQAPGAGRWGVLGCAGAALDDSDFGGR